MPIQNDKISYYNYYKKLYIEQILNTVNKIHCGMCSVVGEIKYNLQEKEYHLHRFEFLKWKIPVPAVHSSLLIYQIYTEQNTCGVQLPIHACVRIYGEILLKPKLRMDSPILQSPRDIQDENELKNYQTVISLHNFTRIYDPESLFISELLMRKAQKPLDNLHDNKIKM